MQQPPNQIILILEEHDGEIQGTEELALALNLLNCKSYVIRCARRLEQYGVITIMPTNGGRGHKTVYKHNRNQPGLARKTR